MAACDAHCVVREVGVFSLVLEEELHSSTKCLLEQLLSPPPVRVLVTSGPCRRDDIGELLIECVRGIALESKEPARWARCTFPSLCTSSSCFSPKQKIVP